MTTRGSGADGGRGARTAAVGLGVAVLMAALLTACASTVTGSGHRAGPTAPTSSSPTAGRTDVPIPAGLRRAIVNTRIGDPVRADLCTIVPEDLPAGAFTQPQPFTEVGTCSRFVYNKDFDQQFTLFVTPITPKYALALSAGETKTVLNGWTAYVGSPDRDSCEIDLVGKDVGIRVQANSAVQPPAACAVIKYIANAMTKSLASSAPVQQRRFDDLSLTTADMCKVLAAAHIAQLPQFRAQPGDYYFGGSCRLQSALGFTYITPTLSDPAVPYTQYKQIQSDGRTLHENQVSPGCADYAVQQTQGGEVEALQVYVAPVGNNTLDSCTVARDVTDRVLTVLGR